MMADTGFVRVPGLARAEADVMQAAAAQFAARPDGGGTAAAGRLAALASPGCIPVTEQCGDYWKLARGTRHMIGC